MSQNFEPVIFNVYFWICVISIHVCVYVYKYTSITYICIYMYTHTYTHTYVCVSVFICICELILTIVKMNKLRSEVCVKSCCMFCLDRRATTCGVGSWRPSGQWWWVTPWWCWSPSTCTSSKACRDCSDRSWACQRRGESILRPFILTELCFHEEPDHWFLLSGMVFVFLGARLNGQSPWPGSGAVRHGGAVCAYPASCRVPLGLHSPAALL